MAQSQIICNASAMGKTRVIRTKFWDRSHDLAPVGGALRTPAACRNFLGIATPVAVPTFKIKIVQLLAKFFTHFGYPRHNIRWPTMPPPRLIARFCVGLHIQVEIQWLRVVSGDLRLNRRRPATTRTFSMIVSDESYGGIVVNRRVYKGTSDRIAKSLRPSCCMRLWQVRKPSFQLKEKTLADVVTNRLRCNRRQSEAHPTIFRQNLVKLL